MPTRQGWTIAVAAVAALVVGRVFAIVELFVIGAGLGAAVGLAVLAVQLHRPELSITRWAHPSVLTVGDTGRVDLLIENRATVRSPRVDLSEPVGTSNSAHMTIAPVRVEARSICVHGDSPGAVAMAAETRRMLAGAGVEIAPFIAS